MSDSSQPQGLQHTRPPCPSPTPRAYSNSYPLSLFAYTRLLMFFPSILIPACNSSSSAFRMMCSAYKLNKQGDNKQPCRTPFSILNQSVVPYRVLTCFLTSIQVSQDTGKVVWYSHLLKDFPQFFVIHTIKHFSVINEAEVDVFLKFPCFLYDPANVDNLISDSSSFSKPSLYIWKFSIHILLNPNLKDFEHDLASLWNECNCAVVWTFFGICPSLGLERKLTFSSPVATDEFSKFADILSAVLFKIFYLFILIGG